MSSTSLAPMPDEALPPLPQNLQSSPNHRRHIRYATPETSTPPHFILETTSNNHRATSNNHRSPRAMSASPPPPALASSSQTHQVDQAAPAPAISGQDHDRMETDEENESDGEDSGAEEDTPEPESQESEIEAAPPPPVEDEAMDTSPDNPPLQQTDIHDHPDQVSQENLLPPTGNSTAALEGVEPNVSIPAVPTEPAELPQPPPTDPNTRESRQARLRAAERELLEVEDLRRADRMRTDRQRRDSARGEGEGDDDSDDSSDEDEHPYWVNFKEDTSSPDEGELKTIEDDRLEADALDHGHWEERIYEPLSDPEYIPSDAGRISWTVKGVHGTPEKPNRETIMRSPSVLIGGFYWNIKYFPRGNDGTEQLSIYIECSPTPYEEAATKMEETPSPNIAGESENIVTGSEQASTQASMDDSADPAISHATEGAGAEDDTRKGTEAPSSPVKSENKDQPSWGIAAQIGCVIYNPEEPRVNVHQIGCHRYYNDNPDWGWTRFHGPWDEIHKRQRFQRQALLRNDTLSFTAYIRTIKDDTKALWWHPAKDKAEWDSVAMTGLKGFECLEYQSSAIVAALSSWMHLQPIERLIRSMSIPDPVWEADKRMRPAFEELQDLYEEGKTFVPSDEHDISLSGLASILNFYGADVDLNNDVVSIWENLRRAMNFEASGLDSVEEGNSPKYDQFKEVLVLKQPDLLDHANSCTKYPLLFEERGRLSENAEPHSVQQAIDKASCSPSNAFLRWQSFEGHNQQSSEHPAVLQIELHRQDYSKEDRKWKKLTHRIELNESVTMNGFSYTLFGMIVHSGDLESHEYSSVIRPEGPGTRWIKYAGDNNERKVSILTSQQAVKAHEGADDTKEGTTAVAQIVLYVRSDALPEVLCTPFKQKASENAQLENRQNSSTDAQDDEMTDSKGIHQDMPVYIYDSNSFQGYSGRGLCDPWQLHKQGNCANVISLPASTTVSKLQEHLTKNRVSADEDFETTEIRLWPMNTYLNTYISDQGVRAFPSLLSYKAHSEETLEEMSHHSGGCRFWKTVAAKIPSATTTPTAPVSDNRETVWSVAQEEAFQAALIAIRSADGQSDQANTTSRDQLVEGLSDIIMSGSENNAEDPEGQRRRREQLIVSMQQAEQQAQQLAAQRAQQRQQESERNAQQLKETYFLVKLFDAENQTLRGFGSAVVKSESRIVEEVKKVLQIPASESWDCYLEHSNDVTSKDQVRSHETFEKKCGGADGCIFIAQRRLNAAEKAYLQAQGKPATPIECIYTLGGHDDPSLFRDHVSSSYFGSSYISGSLKNGFLHGQGTVITLAGDAYNGSFVSGKRAGKGVMHYANGDTYTGEWEADEPNGQGKMTYKNGNEYTGGFKKRKRHGKGTMVYEVADEEMQLCKICYEGEVNAVFNDCGHVVACEECARQVDICPICRKNVRSVVKIWARVIGTT